MFKALLMGLIAPILIQCSFNHTNKKVGDINPGAEKNRVPASVVNLPGILNSERSLQSPYVVLVSIDGFRYDYAKKFNATQILDLAKSGIEAESLQPVFPSLTFPNHYSIITGLYAENHEIVSNGFFDPLLDRKYSLGDGEAVNDGTWYKGQPLWVVADKNEMVSASYFWVGSEAEIDGHRPTYYKHYDGSIPNLDRVDSVIGWLKLPERERPHFITLYFSLVDSAGHHHGTNSDELKESVKEVDAVIGDLRARLQQLKLPINLIVVSDHGMEDLSEEKVIYLDDYADLEGFKIEGRGALIHVYSEDKGRIHQLASQLSGKENFQVYLRKDIPPSFHYSKTAKVGDLIIQPKLPYYLKEKHPTNGDNSLGSAATHGWDPLNKNMHGIFYGEGPQLASGQKIETFENVHIYPLILKILGLETNQPYDGDFSKISKAYKN